LDGAEKDEEQLGKKRKGHDKFKAKLCQIESKCRVTGVTDKRFLIASHIKPWKDCNVQESRDGNNGLLLAPHVDKLFDNFWISFTDNGDLLIANQEIEMIMEIWKIPLSINVGPFNEHQRKYLEHHRSRFSKQQNKP